MMSRNKKEALNLNASFSQLLLLCFADDLNQLDQHLGDFFQRLYW